MSTHLFKQKLPSYKTSDYRDVDSQKYSSPRHYTIETKMRFIFVITVVMFAMLLMADYGINNFLEVWWWWFFNQGITTCVWTDCNNACQNFLSNHPFMCNWKACGNGGKSFQCCTQQNCTWIMAYVWCNKWSSLVSWSSKIII